jgi:hypothetical protein
MKGIFLTLFLFYTQKRTRQTDQSTVQRGSVPTKNQRDIAAYTHSYDLYSDRRMNDDFWRNPNVRRVITRQRFEFHDPSHRTACFKKGCECRALFPKLPHDKTLLDDTSSEQTITMHRLIEGDYVLTKPWLLYPKRPIGCEYINQHSYAVSEVLNCNSNIQIGDPTHVFYSTLYTSKSTQEDDANRQKRIAVAIIRRLVRQERLFLSGQIDRIPDSFSEGISRMLCGLNAATSRDVVSAPMAHLLICQKGQRFRFSHDFAPLLISQMEDALMGRPVRSILRKTRKRGKKSQGGGQEVMWLDSLSNDYLYRPITQGFEDMSLYEFTMFYKKTFGSNDCSDIRDSFDKGHPGRLYSSCERRDKWVVPIVSYIKNSLCTIEDLDLEDEHPSGNASHCREVYAKTALLQFYPYREIEDLKINGSYWSRFYVELQKKRRGMKTKFWDRGFEILQNIDDRLTMQRHGKRPADEVDRTTHCRDEFDTGTNKRKHNSEEEFLNLDDD